MGKRKSYWKHTYCGKFISEKYILVKKCEKTLTRIPEYGMSDFCLATHPPCPILSYFAWPPHPPLKSDIIYVCSLTCELGWSKVKNVTLLELWLPLLDPKIQFEFLKKKSKRQKRSKILENDVKSQMRMVSEWGNWEKVVEKEKEWFFSVLCPNEHEGAWNQTWPITNKSSFPMSTTCTEINRTSGAFF